IWTLLVLGRYADVTAPALYGRDVNLYWDLRYIPDVTAMVVQAAPVWLVVIAVVAAVLFIVVVYALIRWALGHVARTAADPRRRLLLTGVATVLVALFAM